MKKYHPKNERVKWSYFRHLKEAEGRAEATINSVRASITRFEKYNPRFNSQTQHLFTDGIWFWFAGLVGGVKGFVAQRCAAPLRPTGKPAKLDGPFLMSLI